MRCWAVTGHNLLLAACSGHKVKGWLVSTTDKTSMSLIPNDTGLIEYMT